MPRWLSAVLVVVASVLAFAAVLAVWVDRQVLDTDNWATASSELLEIPAVRNRTAAYLADKAYEESDIEGQIASVLPPRLQPLAAPAAGFLRDRLEKRAREALARPEVQQLWEDANRTAHQRLLDALENEGPVTIDLHRLLEAVERRAGFGGRAAAVVPEGAATVTVIRSEQLDSARKGVRILGALPIVLVVLSLALAAAAIYWSEGRRRRVLRGYGIGLIAAGALALGAAAVTRATPWSSSLARTAEGVPVVEGVFRHLQLAAGRGRRRHDLLRRRRGPRHLAGRPDRLGGRRAPDHRAVPAPAGDRLRRARRARRHRLPLVGADAGDPQAGDGDRADRAAGARRGGAAPADGAGVPGGAAAD